MSGAQSIRLRAATWEDGKDLFEWRNNPRVYEYFFEARPVLPREHQAWLAGVLEDTDAELLVAEDGNGPVGVLRYSIDGDVADISIFVLQRHMGRGLGAQILKEGTSWLRAHRTDVRYLLARVLAGNHASAKAFERAGFTEYSRTFRYAVRPLDREE